MSSLLVSTAIPYVNAEPHLGHVLEFVQVDALARHARAHGRDVLAVSGTDDNSLKNVLAARAAGVPTAEFVTANADRFQALAGPLRLAFDEYVRTGSDPRHRRAVERIWLACAENGDLYRKEYQGRYCVGCEAFVSPDELVDGRCPEHGVEPQLVAEENWFFRLSRYTDVLLADLIDGRIDVQPPQRRNEVLAFVRGGLEDFSVSRSRARAGDWGIPVPGDDEQVIYVWFDALVNYLTAAGYGDGDPRWWHGERRHVIGKGILRFHAVYWPAILRSAGLAGPDVVSVHDYLTVDGAKIAKSAGNSADPVALVERYGLDAVRWWLLSEVPKVGDVDFTEARLIARADTDLAGGLGNLVHRTARLLHRAPVHASPKPFAAELLAATDDRIGAALAAFDFRSATDALRSAVTEGNRYIELTQPWRTPRDETALATLAALGHGLADLVEPFLPGAGERLTARLTGDRAQPPFTRLAG